MSVPKTFSFSSQREIGDKGEELFKTAHPEYKKLSEKNDFDFIDESTGKTVEFKTDTYDMRKTENFFIERFGDDKSYKDGGPFRNTENMGYFVYYFSTNDTAYWIDPKKAVEIIEKNFTAKQLVSVRNRNYNTLGFKVNRKLLADAIIKVENLKRLP